MYKGFMIHSSDFKHQPMDTKKDKETETDKDKTEIHNKDYETIRKLVKENEQTIQRIN